MFIEPSELNTVAYDWQLGGITTDLDVIKRAILTAMTEVESYLAAKYDVSKIFATTGDNRNAILVEHTKSIAMWYLLRLSNSDINYERIKDYYASAKEWLKAVAGFEGKSLSPDLPRKEENGEIKSRIRMGSNLKFNHEF